MNTKKMAALVAAGVIALSLTACEVDEGTSSTKDQAQSQKQDKGTDAPQETAGQENARVAAENYLDTLPFSRAGLIDQLKFEGYSVKDATYAVDNVEVNWNEQAVKSAKLYLDTMPFSRSGMIDQLKFDGYTQSQAEYGADKAGL